MVYTANMSDSGELNAAGFPDFPPTDETGDVDLTLLDYTLSLTPAERVRQAEEFSRFAEMVRQAGINHYGMDPRPPEEAE
jgi:hypothetical protein